MNIKKYLIIFCIILGGGITFATSNQLPWGLIESANNGYLTPDNGSSKEIVYVGGDCIQASSTTNTKYFIPTKTQSEIVAFTGNLPTGISITPCYTYSWYASNWGACSQACETGTQTKTVTCLRSDGQTVADGFCSGPKPMYSQNCNTFNCCIRKRISTDIGCPGYVSLYTAGENYASAGSYTSGIPDLFFTIIGSEINGVPSQYEPWKYGESYDEQPYDVLFCVPGATIGQKNAYLPQIYSHLRRNMSTSLINKSGQIYFRSSDLRFLLYKIDNTTYSPQANIATCPTN